MAGHTHRPAASRVVTYRGTARGAAMTARGEDRRAHGDICIVERCACGAARETNRNGTYLERGTWRLDDDARATRQNVSLTTREIATILYALRQVQRNPLPPRGDHFADVEPLTHDEIDTMCERINLGEGRTQ